MPLIYLAFSNSQLQPLSSLQDEDDQVHSLLSVRERARHFRLLRDSHVSIQKVVEYLQRNQDELLLFLYSGHAGRDQLLLREESANAEGIAQLLGRCPRLRLVVLNGCSTRGQVQALLLAGVPVVIATSAPVDDRSAAQFSIAFFRAMAEGKQPIREAFEAGIAAAQVQRKERIRAERARSLDLEEGDADAALWGLYWRAEKDLNWRLPQGVAHHLTAIPPIHAEEVLGRDEDLARLKRKLGASASLLLMNGIGGIGKTTLAKLYASQYGEQYDRLAWIEQDGNLAQSIATDPSLRHSLSVLPEPGEGFEAACARILLALQNLDGHNLLVLDNVNESIRPLLGRLPHGRNWHVLLTSRQRLGSLPLLELASLDEAAARALFLKHCTKLQDEAALTAFLQKLEYHTLSIELFAKLLDAHWEMETVDELSTYLDTNHLDDETLQAVVEVEHARGQTTLYRHLLQAFDLSGIEQVPELMRLLVQMAALPPNVEGYAVKDLMEWFGIETERTTFVNHLNELHSLGWLVQPQTNYFGAHRLIKTIVSHARPASEQDLMPLVETFTQKLNLDQAKDNPVEKFRWIPFGQSVLLSVEHLEFDDKAILQNNLAMVLQDLGDYAGAKSLSEKAMKANEQNFGPDHPNTAVSYSNLALVLKDLGDSAGAKGLMEKAVKSDEQNFGTDHPNTAVSYSNLGTVLKDLGDYARAKGLFEKTINAMEKNFGFDHPNTAQSYANLALVLKALGDYAGAKGLFEKAMMSAEQNFGTDHPTTAVTYSNLALVLQDLEDYTEAKSLLGKAVKSMEKNFGFDHPNTAQAYSNLALVLHTLKDYAGAKGLLEKAVKSNEQNFGTDHPNTAVTYSNLALLLKDLEDFAEAKDLLEKALKSDEQNFGTDHPTTAGRYWNLATVFMALKAYDKARPLLEKAQQVFLSKLGADHPYSQELKSWIAELDALEGKKG